MLILIGVLVCGSGKDRSVDAVLFDFAMLCATGCSSSLLSLVRCSQNGTTLDETMQTNKMNNLCATSQEAIQSTALGSELRKRSSGGVSATWGGTESKLALRGIISRKANEFSQAPVRFLQAPRMHCRVLLLCAPKASQRGDREALRRTQDQRIQYPMMAHWSRRRVQPVAQSRARQYFVIPK